MNGKLKVSKLSLQQELRRLRLLVALSVNERVCGRGFGSLSSALSLRCLCSALPESTFPNNDAKNGEREREGVQFPTAFRK